MLQTLGLPAGAGSGTIRFGGNHPCTILIPFEGASMADFTELQDWLQRSSARQKFYAGTFWFVFSSLGETLPVRLGGQQSTTAATVPGSDWSVSSSVQRRNGTVVETTFWHLPVQHGNVHVFFSSSKPSYALRPMYRMLARARGKAHLFPIGHNLVRDCVRLSQAYEFEQTYIVRGVSYPSRPNEGGADINLRPGNSALFFRHLEDERRILKTARMRAPVANSDYVEYTVGRIGYLSYHKGRAALVVRLATATLPKTMVESAKPFERAQGRFVSFRFSEPFFADRASYRTVLTALSRLPRSSVAVLHANPYFYATVTNYEDGGEFDVFVTGHSSIQVHGRGESSAASFIRLQEGLSEQFRDAKVSIEACTAKHTMSDLLEGRL